MRFSIYIDEDRLHTPLTRALRHRSFDVLTCAEAGMTGKPDDENLAFAAVRGRVIYSANVGDYASLHREWLQSDRGHAGIIVCNDQRWSVGEQLRRIIAVADAKSAEQMVNNLEHLSNFGTEFDR